jgi:hypothetical protein
MLYGWPSSLSHIEFMFFYSSIITLSGRVTLCIACVFMVVVGCMFKYQFGCCNLILVIWLLPIYVNEYHCIFL